MRGSSEGFGAVLFPLVNRDVGSVRDCRSTNEGFDKVRQLLTRDLEGPHVDTTSFFRQDDSLFFIRYPNLICFACGTPRELDLRVILLKLRASVAIKRLIGDAETFEISTFEPDWNPMKHMERTVSPNFP